MWPLEPYALIAAVQHILGKPLHHATIEEMESLSVSHFSEIGIYVTGGSLAAIRRRYREDAAAGVHRTLFDLERQLHKPWAEIQPSDLDPARITSLDKIRLGHLRVRRAYELEWRPPKKPGAV